MIQGVFLQPASIKNKEVKEHLERTIFNPVKLNDILRFVPSIKSSEFNEFLVWGVVPGQSQKQWEKLKTGDIVAFYSERRFYLMAKVIEKLHSENLAYYLWGKDKSGRTWEYIYLMDPDTLLEIDIPLKEVINILGYSENYILQSAVYKENKDLVKLFTDNLLERTSDNKEEDIIETVKREKIKSVVKRIKRDQSFSIKVKHNYKNKCAICRIPNDGAIVDSAHIKPVHMGGPDIEENGIALCKLHHYLFDAGLIGIKDGKMVVSPKATNDLKNHPIIKEFLNKEIELVGTSEKFLNWHYDNIFKK